MKRMLVALVVLCISYNAFSQYTIESLAWQASLSINNSTPETKKIYRPAGFMQEIPVVQNSVNLNLQTGETKSKGGFGRGAWIGAIVGAGAGIITGLIVGNDSCYPHCIGPGGSTGDNVFIYGTAGAFTGALVGGIVGIITKKRK